MRRTMFIRMMIIFMLMTVMVLGEQNIVVDAAQPKIILTGYKIDKSDINAGDTFKLSLTFKNTYSYSVRNIKISVIAANGEILPANGTAGTAYLDNIYGEEEQVIELDMMATKGLEEKSYKLTVKCEYEDGYGSPYTAEDSIFIPIYLKQRVEVTDVLTSDDAVDLGDDIGISGKVNNMGDGKLYNVCVNVSGSVIENQKSYLGNIESGKSGNFDMYVRTTKATEGKAVITVTYEDVKGNVHEYNDEMINQKINVTRPLYEDIVVVKEETPKDNKTFFTLGIVGVVIIFVLVIGFRSISKKRKMLEEYDD